MTEKQNTQIKVLQDVFTKLAETKSPPSGFQSEEFEEGFYEGWFDAKNDFTTIVTTMIDELKG